MGCNKCARPDVDYSGGEEPRSPPLILQLMPPEPSSDPEAKPPQIDVCCPYHWCALPDCPHTCLYKRNAEDRNKPCCKFHWFIPLCEVPTPTSICPKYPCAAEDPAEKEINMDAPSWWKASPPEEESTKELHGACWCNSWKGDLAAKAPPPPAPRKARETVKSRKQQLLEDEEAREKLFPPPPDTICSYKPCVMDMKLAADDSSSWSAIPQKCKKSLKKKEELPCKRVGCLHYQPHLICIYDEPCKAHCYDTPAGLKPHLYPRGYPNYS